MRRKSKTTHHDNLDRWLLTYSDLITLLLGLFVILYAVSNIDAGKYQEVMSALGGVFGSPRAVLTGDGGGGALENTAAAIDNERQQIARDIQHALGPSAQDLAVSISNNERGVTVHLMEELVFASGSADMKLASLPVLDSVAAVLRRLPNDLRVEGHTDNVPISTPLFPSNWHLSVARALNIGYYLILKHGLQADKVSIVGYSEYRPLVLNDTPEHRAKNRRVDIVIVTSASRKVGEGPPVRPVTPIQETPETVL